MKAIIATLLFLLVISCKKEESVHGELEGYAIDAVSKDSVAGVDLSIWVDDNPHSTVYTYKKIVATTKTNENGYYRIKFELPSYDVRIAISSTHPNYENQVDLGPTTRLSGDRLLNMKVLIYPLSWTKFHIKNVPPFLDSDSVRFQGMYTLKGKIDTTVIFQSAIYINNTSFLWYGSANGASFTEMVTACNPFDTCIVNIDF